MCSLKGRPATGLQYIKGLLAGHLWFCEHCMTLPNLSSNVPAAAQHAPH